MYENRLYAGIQAALAELHADGRRLYVVTSKPTVYARRIVAHFELQHFFRAVHGSNLDGSLADKTELLAHVLREEALAPDAAVMVGDRKHDMIGARANRVRAIGVLWGYGSEEELTSSGAHALCPRPALLSRCIDEYH